MKKYNVNKKIEAYTLAFYNEMLKDEKNREFYRIDYYLYFLKKRDLYAFESEYSKTRTGIVWPDNEKLMFSLITQNTEPREEIDPILLNELDQKIVNDIYLKYKGASITKLKELVLDDIKAMELFDSYSLTDQMNVVLKRFKVIYEKEPKEAMNMVKDLFQQHNINEMIVQNKIKRLEKLKKKVI